MKEKYNILIVDDYPYIIDGIKKELDTIISIDKVYTAKSGRETLNKIDKYLIDILIIDIEIGDINGITIIEEIRTKNIDMKIMVQTGYYDIQHIRPLINLGINTIIDKQNIKYDLPKAIDAMLKLQTYYSKYVHNTINQIDMWQAKAVSRKVTPRLTRREKQLLPFLVKGMSNKEIGKQANVSLSQNTVKTHRANIYEKLQVRNAAQLNEQARFWGLI